MTPEEWAIQLEETSVSEPADLFALAMEEARTEALRERDARWRKVLESYAAELEEDAKSREPEIAKMHRRGEEVDAAFHGGGADAQRGIANRIRALLEEAGK